MRAVMPNGVHGEVQIGDTTLMMGGGIADKKFAGKLQPGALHIYVEDADAVTEKAVAAGATLIDELRDQEYGERSSTVKDKAGTIGTSQQRKVKPYAGGPAQRESVPASAARRTS